MTALSGELCELWIAKACKGAWTSRAAADELTADRLEHIRRRFTLLQKSLRVKIILALLYLPPSKLRELQAGAVQLLEIAAADEESQWVRIAAGLVQRWTRVAPAAVGEGPGEPELRAAIEQQKPVIPVFLEAVDTTGHFLGETKQQIMDANLIRIKVLSKNCVPPPDQGFFPGANAAHFKRNTKMLADAIRTFL